MSNAAWSARVVQPRPQHADLLPQRVWALRKDGHEATIPICGRCPRRRRDRAHDGWGAAEEAAVQVARTAGTGRRDYRHPDDVGS